MGNFHSPSNFDWQRNWSRLYPAIEVPFGGRSVGLQAGDGDISYIRGWTLTFGFVGGSPVAGQEIVAKLDLRYPQNGNVSYCIQDFDVSQGGTIFIPWPRIDLTFRDRSKTAPDDKDIKPSQVVVSFVPALSDETVPRGLQSVVYGRSHLPAKRTKAPWEAPVPPGATSYLVVVNFPIFDVGVHLPDSRVYIEEYSQKRVWQRYWVIPEVQSVLYQVVGSNWRRTPPGPGATIHLQFREDSPIKISRDLTATVQWQYELGGYR